MLAAITTWTLTKGLQVLSTTLWAMTPLLSNSLILIITLRFSVMNSAYKTMIHNQCTTSWYQVYHEFLLETVFKYYHINCIKGFVWIGFDWFKIGTGGKLMWMWWWNFRSCAMYLVSLLVRTSGFTYRLHIFVTMYCFVPLFCKTKFCSVPSQAIVEVKCAVGCGTLLQDTIMNSAFVYPFLINNIAASLKLTYLHNIWEPYFHTECSE